MISLSLTLFALFFFNITSAEVLTSWADLERRGTTYFNKSTGEPFTGTLKNFHSNGQIALIDNFKDGKQHGEYFSYHPNGKPLLKGSFENGKQQGVWSEFYENGSQYWKLKYINGKAEDGIFRMFYPDGSLESEVTYGDGKPITNWVYYDAKGKKERVKIYEKGIFIYEKYLK